MFAGKLIDYCEPYVKLGGLILTYSVFSDNLCMKECRENYELIGYIKRKKKINIIYILKVKLQKRINPNYNPSIIDGNI